jgi:hypothetical protein
MALQRDTYTPADVSRMEINDLRAYTGIKECKLKRKADKATFTHSYSAGARIAVTMNCPDACLKECANRNTRKCGDECLMFSNFKAK